MDRPWHPTIPPSPRPPVCPSVRLSVCPSIHVVAGLADSAARPASSNVQRPVGVGVDAAVQPCPCPCPCPSPSSCRPGCLHRWPSPIAAGTRAVIDLSPVVRPWPGHGALSPGSMPMLRAPKAEKHGMHLSWLCDTPVSKPA